MVGVTTVVVCCWCELGAGRAAIDVAVVADVVFLRTHQRYIQVVAVTRTQGRLRCRFHGEDDSQWKNTNADTCTEEVHIFISFLLGNIRGNCNCLLATTLLLLRLTVAVPNSQPPPAPPASADMPSPLSARSNATPCLHTPSFYVLPGVAYLSSPLFA